MALPVVPNETPHNSEEHEIKSEISVGDQTRLTGPVPPGGITAVVGD